MPLFLFFLLVIFLVSFLSEGIHKEINRSLTKIGDN